MAWVGRTQVSGYLPTDTAIVQYFNNDNGHVSAYVVVVSTGWCPGLGEAETDFREIAQIKLTGSFSDCFGSHVIIRQLPCSEFSGVGRRHVITPMAVLVFNLCLFISTLPSSDTSPSFTFGETSFSHS